MKRVTMTELEQYLPRELAARAVGELMLLRGLEVSLHLLKAQPGERQQAEIDDKLWRLHEMEYGTGGRRSDG